MLSRHRLLFFFTCLLPFLNASAALAVSVSPTGITVQENTTQQFSASVASTWSTNCGSISSTGLFKAPLYPKQCTITAVATDGSGSSTASVNVVSPIVMTPAAATTPQGQTQRFTASAPVTWTAACGSITSGGLFTASATVGTYCTIQGIATTSPKYTVYGYDKIGAPATALSISPQSPVILEGATQQFTSSAAATFSASCGTITSAGLYTAPLVPGSCVVTATASTGATASSTASITSPITIAPSSATTAQGQTQQFTANLPVIWTASCGTISSTGLFTASGSSGSTCRIQATATGSTAYTAFASDLTSAGTFTITPPNPTVNEGATQQFSVGGAAATWTTNCGSISATGLFNAPLYPKVCTVTATATSGGQTASTSPNVVSPIIMTPSAVVTPQGQTQQFTASAPVAWTAACGSITAGGLFTASATVGKYCTIQGTATTSPKYVVYGYDKIGSPTATALTIAPLNPTLVTGSTQQFTTSLPASFAANCGTISATGLYTAPSAPATCKITATATDGSGQVSFTSATITASLAITPTDISLYALNHAQFTANLPVTWSDTCNAIDSASGMFVAPPVKQVCTVTATTTSGTPMQASANVAVSILNYTTFRGSVDRGGAQTRERTLTPGNVNSTSFGLAWSLSLDGGIWTQPLYMNGLTVNGAPHNVVFATTANDSVYAIDGDSGSTLWHVVLLDPGATSVPGSVARSSMNPVGIVGTPVIDVDAKVMYVVAFSLEQNGTAMIHRLHALDITTGAEIPGSPVVISFPGFVDSQQMQRAALLLANGRVYVSFGGIGDRAPYQGWIFAYQEDTLALLNVFSGNSYTDATGGGGIWMSGMGPSADGDGNIFLSTGNGYADDIDNYGQSVLKVSKDLDVLDYFTPFDHVSQSTVDLDLGSGGVMLVPDQSGAFPHEAIICGKPTPIYVLNRDYLGTIGAATDNIVQRLDGQLAQTGSFRDSGKACFTTPAFWNQKVYFGANHDVLKMFSLDPSSGQLSSAPVSVGSTTYSWPGAYMAISSNGNSDGIVWAYEPASGTLRATNASDLTKELFVGAVYTNSKWVVPTVVNGHVYIGTQNRVFAFAPR
jgi:hypothetical protein